MEKDKINGLIKGALIFVSLLFIQELKTWSGLVLVLILILVLYAIYREFENNSLLSKNTIYHGTIVGVKFELGSDNRSNIIYSIRLDDFVIGNDDNIIELRTVSFKKNEVGKVVDLVREGDLFVLTDNFHKFLYTFKILSYLIIAILIIIYLVGNGSNMRF